MKRQIMSSILGALYIISITCNICSVAEQHIRKCYVVTVEMPDSFKPFEAHAERVKFYKRFLPKGTRLIYAYDLMDGFSAKLTQHEVLKLKKNNGVVSVRPDDTGACDFDSEAPKGFKGFINKVKDWFKNTFT